MLVNGVWCDNKRRVVLSLKCMYCGATNALKPFIEKEKLQLLDQSGAKWKRVESPLEELIGDGESYKTEFKSSLLWSYREKKVRKELQYDVVKSITSFMNCEGGTLLIGVSDAKEILGIEKDYENLGDGHRHSDGFENRLTEEISRFIGKEYRKYVEVKFYNNLDKKEICVVTVKKSPRPVILRYNDKDEFIVRNGNRTQKLDIREALSYIKMHWESY
jgi:predicted HTH transcriptional regulator